MMGKIFSKLPLVLFAISVVAVVWFYGAVSARFNLFPYPQVSKLISDLRATRRSNNFHAAIYDFDGTKTHLPDQMAPGVTLITTFFSDHEWQPDAKLIDAAGNTLHDWQLDMDKVFANRTIASNPVHGAHLFPNGDLFPMSVSLGSIAVASLYGPAEWQRPSLNFPSRRWQFLGLGHATAQQKHGIPRVHGKVWRVAAADL